MFNHVLYRFDGATAVRQNYYSSHRCCIVKWHAVINLISSRNSTIDVVVVDNGLH